MLTFNFNQCQFNAIIDCLSTWFKDTFQESKTKLTVTSFLKMALSSLVMMKLRSEKSSCHVELFGDSSMLDLATVSFSPEQAICLFSKHILQRHGSGVAGDEGNLLR